MRVATTHIDPAEEITELVTQLRFAARKTAGQGMLDVAALCYIAADFTASVLLSRECAEDNARDEDARAEQKSKKKPAKKPEGGERKRAARGLPPCKMGGRHTWNLQGWCSRCGEVHRDGKVQTQVPGSEAPAADAGEGAAS